MVDLERAVPLLRGMQDIEILSRHLPDGDTLDCTTTLCRALQLMDRWACCTCADPVSEKYDFLLDEIECQEFPAKFVVSVDVADIKLFGPVLATKHADKIDLCIDHRGSHQDFAENSYVDSTVVAACEIAYGVICRLGVVPNQVIVQAVYTGITTDIGCFHYSNTMARAHEIAAQVIRTGIDAGNINRRMFETKAHARLEMGCNVLDSIAFYFDARCAVTCTSYAMIEASDADEGNLGGSSAIPRQIEGALVGVTTRERKTGSYKVSLCIQPQVSAAKICTESGGGGHVAAAGCTIEEDFEPAHEKLSAAIGKALETM